jgi:hypothetical protein
MKSIVMPKNVELSEEEKKQLTSEIKETVAKEKDPSKTKFTASEMWNRQRKSRSASSMMRWNLN